MNCLFVHINFYTQREENKFLIPKIREVYEKYWNLPFPISICSIKEYELENRLRDLEKKLISEKKEEEYLDIIAKATFEYNRILFWGASLFLRKLLFKYPINSSKILGIVDKDSARKGEQIGNYMVFSVEEVKELNPDLIIVGINKDSSRVKDSIERLTEKKIKVITL